ncbi:PA14 domain-containing protein [Occallatibacter riparius]|uniref:PA14 domain-containing protein n=1 Tax=Occallatibacter riparius TaxID=1002689 RepID=A0A9J7BUX4_9BACT|nr:PA14 domain-containing protein [Occallatibacter riparius]UWZ86424.1 PA14 domain-containing protein [Occallatibacter riparius]
MRRHLLEVLLLALLVRPLLATPLAAQTAPAGTPHDQNPQGDTAIPTFRIVTREVLVDVIALDRHNKPVLDLKPDELEVSESTQLEPNKKHSRFSRASTAQRSLDPITSLSLFDPNNPASAQRDTPTGFRILASCLERSTVHYLLAIHPGPSGSTSGYHQITITSRRPDTRLFYRHHYYVGLAASASEAPALKQQNVDALLQQSACYYPVAPLSISLHARLIDTGRTDVVRYLVSVDANSLAFLTLDSNGTARTSAGLQRSVAVDYGACNFDADGKPASYFHAPLEQVLTSADYARALDRGFPHILEFPASSHIALTRIVARDRATGNMGAADLTLPQPQQRPASQAAPVATSQTKDRQPRETSGGRDGQKAPPVWDQPARGTIGSFGSIVPAAHSFCGDVYELARPSDRLPDFRALDPIGAIYTPSLDVPNQFFQNTSGIPGVTPRTNLFGIDYHASFWITTPGEYRFHMASDDGALLEIDDKQIIDIDGLHEMSEGSASVRLEQGQHTVHVPYYQGAVVSVALQLWIKPPGASNWALFDLRDYSPPAVTESRTR